MANVRSTASVNITFGLVTIPVEVYSAINAAEQTHFHLLRASDSSRVRQQYLAVKDSQPVERRDLVKGYEFAKDQYVTFSAREIKELEDATTHSIDIQQFVPLASVDPVYFRDAYYLAPGKGGAKPYSLLAKALEHSQQAAVGRWVSRGKEHIVLIRAMEQGLALHQLHFKAEVRTLRSLGIERSPVSDSELKLAEQLIQHLAVKRFDPNEFRDEYRARVQAAIERKVEGEEVAIAEAPEAPRASNVIDLMAALKESLAGKHGTTGGRHGPRRARAIPASAVATKAHRPRRSSASRSSSRR